MMAVIKEVVKADKAPAAVGPYSAAIRAGQFIYTSGQLPLDPASGEIVPGGIEAQTRQVLTNLKNVLEAGGASLDQVVKTTVFLTDIQEFSKMNSVYAEYFQSGYPARSAFQVVALPKGAAVEIEAVAIILPS
jgi:2-iminobutanoate/2-iminopropanoate deaminase